MVISIEEQSNVIRHMGYPVQGLFQNAPAGGSFAYGNAGYRFLEAYGPLLYRLTQMAPNEESRLVGAPFGAIGFSGLDPAPGDTVTVTLSGGGLASPVTKTITVPAINIGQSPWTLVTVAANLASAFGVDPVIQSAGFICIADYGAGPYTNAKISQPIVSFRAPIGQQTFSLVASNVGQTAPAVISPPRMLSPFLNFSRAGVNNVVYGFLPILDYLEGAYGGAVATQGVMTANDVTLRMDELDRRDEMYEKYREKLSIWLKIPLGDDTAFCGDGGSKNLRSRF